MKRFEAEDLVIIEELDQDSDDWLSWRNEGIGSSDVAVLMSPEPVFDRTVGTLWKQKIGYERAPQINNPHVKRGKELEPEVRDMVNEMLGTAFEPKCILRQDSPYLRASLDGLDLSIDALLEIKSPSDKVFEKYLKSWEIPKNYYEQMQYQMLVSNVEYGYFAFYNETHPHPYIITVENDFELQLEIEKRCAIFWKGVLTKTPVGWENNSLRLFHTKPTAFLVICSNEQKKKLQSFDLTIPVNPAILNLVCSSFVYTISPERFDLIPKLKDLAPDHQLKIINLTSSPFFSAVSEVDITEEGILGVIKGCL
jgi:putative phage-type endonuclease